MEAKQYVTKQPMDHWRNQRGNQKHLETNETQAQWSKTLGHSKSSSNWEVYTNKILP